MGAQAVYCHDSSVCRGILHNKLNYFRQKNPLSGSKTFFGKAKIYKIIYIKGGQP